MKNIVACIGLLIVFPAFLFAQVSNKDKNIDPQINIDNITKNVSIAFARTNTVYNLLVHLNDSTGNTIFLDNQYQFKGQYNKSIDMKKQKKGTYFLEIIEDNKHTNKKIVLQ
jgi:hypothetical protein